MFLHAVGPEQPELRAGAQAVVKLRDLGTADAAEAGIAWPAAVSVKLLIVT
jgi:hypothetical protein